MTERTWQGLGVAALAVGIVLGLMPLLRPLTSGTSATAVVALTSVAGSGGER